MSIMAEVPVKKTALVIDESHQHCAHLSHLLASENYEVFCGDSSQKAITLFDAYHPDLVLVDINLPGKQAMTSYIKRAEHNRFSSLLFITKQPRDDVLLESVQIGADGVLSVPFSEDAFKAQITSLQRICDMHQRANLLFTSQQHDAELAEQLLASVIDKRNYHSSSLNIVKRAASLFSGDIQITEKCPNGDINVLLGDFTGHGLRSSIGTIPVAETFRSMTKKGFSLIEISAQINQLLFDLLPRDLFLAAGIVKVSAHERSIYAFNAGIPSIYHIDGDGSIKRTVDASHPPLGVIDRLMPDTNLEVFSFDQNDRILLISDGVIEARNILGEFYEYERFHAAFKVFSGSQNFANQLLKAIDTFGEGMEQSDDISIIDIDCKYIETHQKPVVDATKTDTVSSSLNIQTNQKALWSWQLSVNDEQLASVNPVPLAMNQLKDLAQPGEHWQSVYTILTELYVNALDHGILNLDSALKNSPEGFAQYFNKRAEKLALPITGSVSLSINLFEKENGGRIHIRVEDTGEGFDVDRVFTCNETKDESLPSLSGWGIELVSQLCESLVYQDNGRCVDAYFQWGRA